MLNYPVLPTPFSGSCDPSQSFIITNMTQVVEHDRELLPCLIDAGVVPLAPPDGPAYGKAVSIGSGTILDPLAEAIWKGKFFTKSWCSDGQGGGEYKSIMFNYLFQGRFFFPAEAYIGPVPFGEELLHDDEPPLGTDDYLIVDYRRDYEEYCPQQTADPEFGAFEKTVFLKQFNNRFPFSNIIDLIRIVGTSEHTGMPILAGRTLIRDTLGAKYHTLAYFSLTTDDPQVGVSPGPSISPRHTFDFKNVGFFGIWKDFMPLAGLVTKAPHDGAVVDTFFKSLKSWDTDKPMAAFKNGFLPRLSQNYTNYFFSLDAGQPRTADLVGELREFAQFLTGK